MVRKKSIDKERLTVEILSYLKRFGKTSASVLCQMHHLSQPSLSRILAGAKNEIIVIGKAQKTQYAAKREIDTHLSSIPIYEIDENGRSTLFGILTALEPKGFIFSQKSKVKILFFPLISLIF